MSGWRSVAVVLGSATLVSLGAAAGCGTTYEPSKFMGSDDASGDGSGGGDDGSTRFGSSSGDGSSGGGTGSSSGKGTGTCPTGLKCNVACPTGTTTTISGTVYDPAGKNPLYGITVYVPAGPLPSLPAGVPAGADACSCAALYKSGAIVSTTTDVQGNFTLKDAPVGANVKLVLQSGKWRHIVTVASVASCAANPQGKLLLNGTVPAGSEDSLPDIAVSTGDADTLECLMKRIGLPDTEYVAGNATGGHVHVFSGGQSKIPILLDQTNPGVLEATPMPGAPASDTSLWDSIGHLLPYDILLLSCEGGETYDANPPVLEQYLNQGGRAFASHYHYSWFSGPLVTKQGYAAPKDWGPNLASWHALPGEVYGPDDGVMVQTLNGGGGPFVKGQYLSQWLANVGALGQNGVPSSDLSIYLPRYNAVVGPTNGPSQPWITDQPSTDGGAASTQTMYFSFDTPVGGTTTTDGGAPAYCGRAVFSDLHVAGDPSNGDTPNDRDNMGKPSGQPPPGGCKLEDLSPQEKALEFMLFDLSSCVVPDDVAPPAGIPVIN